MSSNDMIKSDIEKNINNLVEKLNLNIKEKEETNLEKFKTYYFDNLDKIDIVEDINARNRFVKEYPIERIKNLELNEYALGTEDYKNSLSYKLEFGEYKGVLRIGGGSAAKHGIYYSGDNKYHGIKNEIIDNPEEYWNNFREQLFNFLKSIENLEDLKNIRSKYPLIASCPIILTKLCFLYYPTKFVNIGSWPKLVEIMDYFEINYDKTSISTELSFSLSKFFKDNFEESKNKDPQYIGNLLWKFMDEKSKENHNENGGETTMQAKFKQWLLENGLMETTVNGYINAINLTSREAMEDGIITKELFNIENVLELDKIIDVLSTNEKFLKRKENTHNHNSAPLNRYRDFLSMISTKPEAIEEYDKNKFLEEVFITEDKYDSIVSILSKKKNIILEGAPGVGKTFMAKRLAYSIIGAKDKSKVELIQFHQSYSYEEFIEGYRPVENGFELQRGIFYKLCKKAENDKSNNYYLVIDEINRGNLSKLFGELLMLIEADKRGNSLKLAYSEEEFSVPENLYIIGLMNTADRSLALIDYALRRRFSFIKIEPAFESEKFRKAFKNKFDKDYDDVINIIIKINEAIKNDKSLGEGFKIGHSYFFPDIKDRKGNKKDIQDIINYEIIPLLEEYWYDDEDSLVQWENALNGVINDD